MKTLYLTDSSCNIVVDKENDTVGRLYSEDRYYIRDVYYIEEPMHVVYQCGETKEEIDAKKGDILLLFYSNRFNKYHLDTIKTKQWAANIKNRRAIEQKEKEEWALKNADSKCCCDCPCLGECCCNTASPFEDTPCEDVKPENPAPKKQSAASKIKKMLKKAVKKG